MRGRDTVSRAFRAAFLEEHRVRERGKGGASLRGVPWHDNVE